MSAPAPPVDMTPEQWRIVQDILQRHLPTGEVWAFGSRAKGTAKPYSDLDLVIVSKSPTPLAKVAELNEAFSNSDLPWKVDIVDWALVDQRFRSLITRNKVPVSSPGR